MRTAAAVRSQLDATLSVMICRILRQFNGYALQPRRRRKFSIPRRRSIHNALPSMPCPHGLRRREPFSCSQCRGVSDDVQHFRDAIILRRRRRVYYGCQLHASFSLPRRRVDDRSQKAVTHSTCIEDGRLPRPPHYISARLRARRRQYTPPPCGRRFTTANIQSS